MAETEGAVAPVDPTIYINRAHAFVGRRTYRLTDNALTWEEEEKPLDGVFYDQIAEVRLAYAPTRVVRNRYRAQVIFREGGMAEIYNTDYQGFGDMPEDNEAYVAFLRELHRRIAASGGKTIFRKGNSTVGYILNMLLTIFIFVVLALVFVLVVSIGAIWIVFVKLAIILFYTPALIKYIKRSKPAEYDPLDLPEDALPAFSPA